MSVLTGQATQREAAEKWKVDRSTVVHICRTARQGALAASVAGRPGMTAGQAALAEARQENAAWSHAGKSMFRRYPSGHTRTRPLPATDGSKNCFLARLVARRLGG